MGTAHAYDCSTQKTMGRFWGRGNGWIITTLAEMLRLSKKDHEESYLEESGTLGVSVFRSNMLKNVIIL